MAEKKDQHLVPACYLKEFVAEVPSKHKNNILFEQGVYVNNKFLSSTWKLRSVSNSIFTKSYFYNLEGDSPKAPKIEEYLSSIERYYSKTLQRLKTGVFSNEILYFFSCFTCLQYMRVEPFINMMQGSFDQIGKWADEFSGNNDASNEMADITKKMLMRFEHGEMLHPHSAIIFNSTNFPFITSDNPVQCRQVNTEDLSLLFGKQYVKKGQRKSVEKAFSFFPLTPKIAYVSCELMKDELKGSICILNDLLCIYWINYHSIRNAYENVYSSIVEPIKGENKLSEFLINDVVEDSGYRTKIYTENDRFSFSIANYKSTNEMIEFTTDNVDFCNLVSVGEDISLIEVFDNGRCCMLMRECFIELINPILGHFTIVTKIKLGI